MTEPLRLAYFPGCSAHGTGRELDRSTRRVCQALGIELRELDDWSCCGATAAHAIGGELHVQLCAPTLAQAAELGLDLLTLCAACFHNLATAARVLDPTAADREDGGEWSGAGEHPEPLPAPVRVWSLPELLATAPVLERMASRVARPLAELSLVAYYGCLLVRPPEITGVSDPENPLAIDTVGQACGATVIDWPYKTRCCGGGLFVSHPDLVAELSGPLVAMARRVGADCIVTACPICHANLESHQWRQQRAARGTQDRRTLPVLYLSELVGLALGLDGEDWWRGHLVDPRPIAARPEVSP